MFVVNIIMSLQVKDPNLIKNLFTFTKYTTTYFINLQQQKPAARSILELTVLIAFLYQG